MPTPFTHLRVASRLLADEALPPDVCALLNASRGAFLLGNIAADARVSSGISREQTHFYAYDRPVQEHPWRLMLQQYPALVRTTRPAQRAFVAGYVAHLTLDEVWSLEMIRPFFAEREWASRDHRFLMLNLLLIWMDRRDYAQLEAWQREALLATTPDGWAPFIPDEELAAWRDFVGCQLPPGGESQTLAVIGERIGTSPDALRALLNSEERMNADLWAHVPPEALARVEAEMYALARTNMLLYLDNLNGGTRS